MVKGLLTLKLARQHEVALYVTRSVLEILM